MNFQNFISSSCLQNIGKEPIFIYYVIAPFLLCRLANFTFRHFLYISIFFFVYKTINKKIEMKRLRQSIFFFLFFHLNMNCLGYNTGLHQYTPITSFQGIKCGGDFKSTESLDKAMQACDRLAKCTSIATDINFHRSFPIDQRDYDNGCGKSGHHYVESFYLCQGNVYSKYGGSFDCAFTRGRIVYFDPFQA